MPRSKGFHHSEETKQKIRDKRKLQVFSEETRIKFKTRKNGMLGRNHTDEAKEKMRAARLGKPSPLKGKHQPEYVKERLKQINLGKTRSLESRIKHSCTRRNIPIEEFDGFSKYKDYCDKFNFPFKERVREFFGRKCVECGKDEEHERTRLHVHHVNYDKGSCCNTSEKLFVALCQSCHNKTHTNRDHWMQRYREVIYLCYGGRCYPPQNGE